MALVMYLMLVVYVRFMKTTKAKRTGYLQPWRLVERESSRNRPRLQVGR